HRPGVRAFPTRRSSDLLEKQGLFVVGHARSGTSILMQALNTSPDIFLLGEANLYVEGLRIGFPRWFNDMHRQFGNTLGKGSYCRSEEHTSELQSRRDLV